MSLIDDAIAQALAATQPQDPGAALAAGAGAGAAGLGAGAAPAAANTLDAFMAPPAPHMGFQPPPQEQPPLPGPGAPAPSVVQPPAPMGGGPPPTAQPAPVEDAYGPTFTPPKPPATLGEADQQVGTAVGEAGQAAADSVIAEKTAERARANRVAAVQTQYVDWLTEAQQSRAMAKANASAAADMETAQHLQKMQDLAAKEPNPGRWFENQSALGQALWALSLLFGSVHAGITPGARNAALDMVRQNIDQDVKLQQERLGKELAALREKGASMKDRQQRVLSDLDDEYTQTLHRYQALERAFETRAVAPGDEDMAAAKAQAKALFAELKLPYISKWRDMRFQEKESANARAHDLKLLGIKQWHDKRMQDDAQEFTKEENFRGFQYDLAKSPVSLGVGAGSQRNPMGKDGPLYYELSERTDQSGAPQVLLGTGDGKKALDGAVLFKDRQTWEAANKSIANADKIFDLATRIRDELKAEGSMWESAGVGVVNPKLNAMIQEYGYAIAQAQNDKVTDKDYSSGVQQAMGFDPNGNWLTRGKFALSTDEVVKMLDETIGKHHVSVEAGLQQFNNPALNGRGTKILYRPANLKGPDAPKEETSADVRGEGPIASATLPAGSPAAAPPVKDIADYDRRSKQAATNPELADLPDHDRATVASLRAAAEGRGPETVAKKAEQVLNDIAKRAEKLNAEVEAAYAEGDRWSGSGNLDSAKLQKAGQELARLKETEAIVRVVADDATKRAAKTLERFKSFARVSRRWEKFDTSRPKMYEHAIKNLNLSDKKAIDRALDEVEAEGGFRK